MEREEKEVYAVRGKTQKGRVVGGWGVTKQNRKYHSMV